MNELIIITLLGVFLEVASPMAVVTIQNDLSKPPKYYTTLTPPRRRITSLSSPTLSRSGYGSGIITLQPRNAVINMLNSPIQSFIDYLMSGLYALGGIYWSQTNTNLSNLNNSFSRSNSNTISSSKTNNKKKKPAKTTPFQKPSSTNFNNSLSLPSLGHLTGLTSLSGLINTISMPSQSNNAKTLATIKGEYGKIYVDGVLKYSNDDIFKNKHEVHIRNQDGNFYLNGNLVMKKGGSDHQHVFYSTHKLDYYGILYFTLTIYSNGYLSYSDSKGGNLNVNYYVPVYFG